MTDYLVVAATAKLTPKGDSRDFFRSDTYTLHHTRISLKQQRPETSLIEILDQASKHFITFRQFGKIIPQSLGLNFTLDRWTLSLLRYSDVSKTVVRSLRSRPISSPFQLPRRCCMRLQSLCSSFRMFFTMETRKERPICLIFNFVPESIRSDSLTEIKVCDYYQIILISLPTSYLAPPLS